MWDNKVDRVWQFVFSRYLGPSEGALGGWRAGALTALSGERQPRPLFLHTSHTSRGVPRTAGTEKSPHRLPRDTRRSGP
jgi:hypothetical protein